MNAFRGSGGRSVTQLSLLASVNVFCHYRPMGASNFEPVNVFREISLPRTAHLAGYAALVAEYDLSVPLPSNLTVIGRSAKTWAHSEWRILTPAHAPANTFTGHLEFALKWEGVNLQVLQALFSRIDDADVASFVRETPLGKYTRRAWFLFEWLMDRRLDVPDAGKVRSVEAVDPAQQFALTTRRLSKRHRVVDNMPGTRDFCPLVRRTPALAAWADRRLDTQARDVIGRTHPDLLARASAFLLLSDSRSSFAIEGERPSTDRAARWASAIAEAGRRELTMEELERLQRIVIGDDRFVRLGLRSEGGFVGRHDRLTREPVPDHVSARPEDLLGLMKGLIAHAEKCRAGGVDPVVTAATVAFGFVFIHPFVDGNGRLHRWLIHHELAARGYNPPGLPLPVSAAILRRIDEYRRVLEAFSRPLLSFIEWRPTASGNVDVIGETAHHYRYFDATSQAEFLYACVAETIERDLPGEVAFLEAFDSFTARVKSLVDMPDPHVDLLHRFLVQGNGRLSQRARSVEFAALTDAEVHAVETAHAHCFDGIVERTAGED